MRGAKYHIWIGGPKPADFCIECGKAGTIPGNKKQVPACLEHIPGGIQITDATGNILFRAINMPIIVQGCSPTEAIK